MGASHQSRLSLAEAGVRLGGLKRDTVRRLVTAGELKAHFDADAPNGATRWWVTTQAVAALARRRANRRKSQ